MNVHPHGVNRTPGSSHYVRLAIYQPLEVTCPFTDVSVVVAVLSDGVLSAAVLLAAVLAADALAPSAPLAPLAPRAPLAPLAPPGRLVPLGVLEAAGVAGGVDVDVDVGGAGLAAMSVISPTSMVSSDVAPRNW